MWPEQAGYSTPNSFELAREYPSRYYLRVDDDIFLHPAQLQWIYWSLRQSADRPHGIFGAAFTADKNPEQEWPFVHLRNTDATVEILNGLFAFTRDHLEEYFRLCGLLGITDQKTLMNGEDIVLSYSGDKQPLIHNIGPIWEYANVLRRRARAWPCISRARAFTKNGGKYFLTWKRSNRLLRVVCSGIFFSNQNDNAHMNRTRVRFLRPGLLGTALLMDG